jgi:hypothetical protein
MGRPPIGLSPMSSTERSRRRREQLKQGATEPATKPHATKPATEPEAEAYRRRIAELEELNGRQNTQIKALLESDAKLKAEFNRLYTAQRGVMPKALFNKIRMNLHPDHGGNDEDFRYFNALEDVIVRSDETVKHDAALAEEARRGREAYARRQSEIDAKEAARRDKARAKRAAGKASQ